jgi:hypothetical protein
MTIRERNPGESKDKEFIILFAAAVWVGSS